MRKWGSIIKIGIIDADLLDGGTRFPNIALEKISGFYKSQGHGVDLITSYKDCDNYDKVFLSKVFSSTTIPAGIIGLHNVEYGGTGFFFEAAPNLPYEIEHHMPDYTLYDKYIIAESSRGVSPTKFNAYQNYSIGFATRGVL